MHRVINCDSSSCIMDYCLLVSLISCIILHVLNVHHYHNASSLAEASSWSSKVWSIMHPAINCYASSCIMVYCFSRFLIPSASSSNLHNHNHACIIIWRKHHSACRITILQYRRLHPDLPRPRLTHPCSRSFASEQHAHRNCTLPFCRGWWLSGSGARTVVRSYGRTVGRLPFTIED